MTTDNFCFYFQQRLIQSSQTGGQWYSNTFLLVFPACARLTPIVAGAGDVSAEVEQLLRDQF